MKHYAFLLGRPGCGKSTAYSIIHDYLEDYGITSSRIDNFSVLKEMLSIDKEFKRHILKDGGFEITDYTILDESLQEVCRRAKHQRKSNKIVFIEFARNNYDHALDSFTKDILDESLSLYIYNTFVECCDRNTKRLRLGTDENHSVPLDRMQKYFLTDDYEQAYLNGSLNRAVVIDNSSRDIEKLKSQIKENVMPKLI